MKPILQALLLADQVYEDRRTRKKIIAGTFHHLNVIKKNGATPHRVSAPEGANIYPPHSVAGSPCAYMSVTEVVGTIVLELRYVYLNDDSVSFKCDIEVESTDPLATAEIVVPLPLLPTSRPGTYALELLWENEPLGSHRVIVTTIEESDDVNS